MKVRLWRLPPKEVAALAEAARQTKGEQMCLANGRDVGCWLSDSELFSRVYAQWVAERAQHADGEALFELDAIQSSADAWQQFEGKEWRR